MPTVGDAAGEPPNLYSGGENYPAMTIPQRYRTVAPEILYVTDRRPVTDDEGAVSGYSEARSDSVALGSARVRFGSAEDWPALVRRTHADKGEPITRLMSRHPRSWCACPRRRCPSRGRATGWGIAGGARRL